jgi:Uma2 family endonuclease
VPSKAPFLLLQHLSVANTLICFPIDTPGASPVDNPSDFISKRTPMGLPAHQPVFSADDYLAWESTQVDRHEYLDGEVFAMAGAEDRHVTTSMNIAFALRQHLSSSPCRTFMTDMRLQVAEANSYFYPDVMVTCSALDLSSPLVKTEPRLIIEVLSPSTAAYDRGLKFRHYRSLTSLQEYVLVDLDTRSTDCYRKGPDGLWVLHPFARGESVTLASVELVITDAQMFAEVDEV